MINEKAEIEAYQYKFVYKDENGDLRYKIITVDKNDSELAIATFEFLNKDLVWRSFEKFKPF